MTRATMIFPMALVILCGAACGTRIFAGSPREPFDGGASELDASVGEPFDGSGATRRDAAIPRPAPSVDAGRDSAGPDIDGSAPCAAVTRWTFPTPLCATCAGASCCKPFTECSAGAPPDGGFTPCELLNTCTSACAAADAGVDGGVATCDNACVTRYGAAATDQLRALYECVTGPCGAQCK